MDANKVNSEPFDKAEYYREKNRIGKEIKKKYGFIQLNVIDFCSEIIESMSERDSLNNKAFGVPFSISGSRKYILQVNNKKFKCTNLFILGKILFSETFPKNYETMPIGSLGTHNPGHHIKKSIIHYLTNMNSSNSIESL